MSGSVPDGVEQEARALGDPTRHRIFRHIAEARRPVGVAELTELVGLNHNVVRQHLAVLNDADLVFDGLERRNRPGRPRLLYRLNPDVRGTWGTTGPYELLAALLSEVVRTEAPPRDVGRVAGRQRARFASGAQGGLLGLLEEDMAGSGFHPVALLQPGGCDFVLGRCPFVEVATKDPATVCQLHLGLLEGVASALEEGAVVELVAEDPRRAGCRVRVRLAAEAADEAEQNSPENHHAKGETGCWPQAHRSSPSS